MTVRQCAEMFGVSRTTIVKFLADQGITLRRPGDGVDADADALHASMRASGIDADEVLRWDGVPPMFAFRDRDGNGMEIIEQP